MSKEETIEVTFKTFKLPKRLMDMLKNENYLGWNKDHFFVAATISFISCNVGDMDFDDMKKFHNKYGENLGTVYFETDNKLKVLS